MSFPVVDRATFPPGNCLVTGDIEGPFFDFGDKVCVDPRVYVHVPVIEACARKLGMVPKAEVEELKRQITLLEPKAAAWDAYTQKEIAA